jgi:hypothetical protein
MKHPYILYLSKILILTAFYFIVYNTHITKITKHISVIWIFVMLIAQILSFIYAIINDLAWDRVMSFAFIIGISYIIHIKLKYEMHKDIDIELALKKKNILE